MRIGLAQINVIVGDLAGNQNKIIDYIKQAKNKYCDVVVFPELAVCGYPPEDLLFKDHFVKENIHTLKNIKNATKGITAIVGFVDLNPNKQIFNAAAVITNGVIKGVYHKQELPNYGVFDEKRYFTSGKKEKTYTLNEENFAVNICEDMWIEGGPYKTQVNNGARCLINISCSPYDVGKIKKREAMLKKRAKATNSYVCYVNLVGGQDELVFDGASVIVDPKGRIAAAGSQFKEELVVCDMKIPQSKQKRGAVKITQKSKTINKGMKTSIPVRLEVTEAIYHALILGTKDYVTKNGFKKVVIGLSGGIDSGLVAAIAVEALGKSNVIGVSMPSKYSSKGTQSDAKKLAKNLGIEFKEIPIKPAVNTYDEMLKPHFKGKKADMTEENIQARIRGNLLMALSNKFGWLVLTTGNKSEVAVGYCTLYGDMTGGFAVIKDIPKMKVYEISRFINDKAQKAVIPTSMIERAPSAELRPNQKDQDSLPDYAILDRIVKGYVEEHQSISQISKGSDLDVTKKIIGLVDRSEYKRRQAPPGIKITSRAFGKDWRLPITNKYKEF